MRGRLLRFDIASEKLVAGPIDTGFNRVRGLCVKDEYVAADDRCRAIDPEGHTTQVWCAVLENCGNLTDDDGDGLADQADLDCRIPGLLHALPAISVPPPEATAKKR